MEPPVIPPKISVIIPVYNGAQYLARAINSALAQTYPAHEIIVIDDESIDSTPSVIERYKDRILTRRIKNSGAAGARNAGLEIATGDLVAFLDHDDIWFKDKLEKQVEAAERFPDVGLICCDFAVRYPHLRNRIVKHFSVLPRLRALNMDEPLKENPFKALIQEHFVGTSSSVMVRRNVIKQVGLFNPAYRSSQDYDYWLRCALSTKFLILSDVLLYKKNHSLSVSQNTLRTHLFRKQILLDTLRNYENYIREHQLEDLCMQSLANCYYCVGNLHFEACQIWHAYKAYVKGLWAKPTLPNFAVFLWNVSKKTLRLLTFNLVSRKNVSRLR